MDGSIPNPQSEFTLPSKVSQPPLKSSLEIKHRFLNLLKLCSSIKHLSQLHALLHAFGLQSDSFLVSELVRFCALSPRATHLCYARALVLRSGDSPTTPSWNFLIRAYASGEAPREAVAAFRDMRRRGIAPNNLTLPFVFKACASVKALREGIQVQIDAFKFGLNSDVYIGNNLIHFYGSCKETVYAIKVFDEMPDRSIVSWNSVITSCIENSRFGDGIRYFVKMRKSRFEPDQTTMVLVLSALTELGNLSSGRSVHSQVIVTGTLMNCKLGTALVVMYTKSGALSNAKLLFEKLEERNVWTWSAMILGLAQHGRANEALELFKSMTGSSMAPNSITFLGVLWACSHAGLVHKAQHYFKEMQELHGIKPKLVHYGAMVDVLSRAGRFTEAYRFIGSMPIEPDPVVWRTLLSACGTNRDGVADKVRKRLLALEPRKCNNLVMVANIYAGAGMWKEAAEVRKTMRRRRMKKPAGESCVEIGGLVRRFLSGYDDSKDDYKCLYELLDGLSLQMKTVSL